MAGETSNAIIPVVGSIVLGFFTLLGVVIQTRRRPREDDKDLDVIVSLSEAYAEEKERNRDLTHENEVLRIRAENCEAREQDRGTPP